MTVFLPSDSRPAASLRHGTEGRPVPWAASMTVHGAVLAILLLWPPEPAVVPGDSVVPVELVTMAAAAAAGGEKAPSETASPPVQEAAAQPDVAAVSDPPPEPQPSVESAAEPPPLTTALADFPPPDPPPPVSEDGLLPAEPPSAPAPAAAVPEPVSTPVTEPPPVPRPRPAPPERPHHQPERPKPTPRVAKAPAVPLSPASVQTPVAVSSGAPSAPASAAPSPATSAAGRGEGADGAPAARAADFPPDYLSRLRAWLERHKRYPEQARMLRTQGVATLWFRMARDGTVLAWRIDRGSGSPLLDEAVRAMIESASPLPALPAEVAGGTLELRVPVAFRLVN